MSYIGEVYINKWDGEKFENDATCDVCFKQGTVIMDGYILFGIERYICIGCLEEKVRSIKKAVLESKINI